MKNRLCFLIFFFYSCIILNAQKEGDPIIAGNYKKLFSKILNEERTLLIKLPQNYSGSNKHYPVLYMFDGYEETFINRNAEISQLQDEGLMPEVITIAIVNTDRNRDMFPFRTLYHRTSGGGDNFIKFISDELLPFIDNSFRTTSHKTLAGFSASAMFTLYYFLTQPDNFDAYLLSSPSISFDTDFFIGKLKQMPEKYGSLNKTLSIVFGSSEGKEYYGDQDYYDMKNAVNLLTTTLKHYSPRGLNWSIKSIPGGSHVPKDGVYEGLKKVFEDWQPITKPIIHPAGGFFNSTDPLLVSINPSGGNAYYTIDGSEPTTNSSKYTGPVSIKDSITLKVKIINDKYGEGVTASAVFKQSVPLRNVSIKGNISSGLKYDYYEDYFYRSALPELKKDAFIESGLTDRINIGMKKRYEGFAISFSGFINIPANGKYTFYIQSNDESKLIIDNQLIINREAGYGHDEKSGIVILDKGYHSINILYVAPPFKKKLDLAVFIEGQGMTKQQIPSSLLFHTN